jgi:hypothetical protein
VAASPSARPGSLQALARLRARAVTNRGQLGSELSAAQARPGTACCGRPALNPSLARSATGSNGWHQPRLRRRRAVVISSARSVVGSVRCAGSITPRPTAPPGSVGLIDAGSRAFASRAGARQRRIGSALALARRRTACSVQSRATPAAHDAVIDAIAASRSRAVRALPALVLCTALDAQHTLPRSQTSHRAVGW